MSELDCSLFSVNANSYRKYHVYVSQLCFAPVYNDNSQNLAFHYLHHDYLHFPKLCMTCLPRSLSMHSSHGYTEVKKTSQTD